MEENYWAKNKVYPEERKRLIVRKEAGDHFGLFSWSQGDFASFHWTSSSFDLLSFLFHFESLGFGPREWKKNKENQSRRGFCFGFFCLSYGTSSRKMT